MDPSILGPLIPVVAILAFAAVKVAGIWARAQAPSQDPQTAARLAALEDEVGTLRRELEEAHERIDFTERLLTQQHRDRLTPPT
jgi:hypothetical protein